MFSNNALLQKIYAHPKMRKIPVGYYSEIASIIEDILKETEETEETEDTRDDNSQDAFVLEKDTEMLKVEVPKDKEKLERQIEGLKYQLSLEISEKDRRIFEETLRIFKEEKKKRGVGSE